MPDLTASVTITAKKNKKSIPLLYGGVMMWVHVIDFARSSLISNAFGVVYN